MCACLRVRDYQQAGHTSLWQHRGRWGPSGNGHWSWSQPVVFPLSACSLEGVPMQCPAERSVFPSMPFSPAGRQRRDVIDLRSVSARPGLSRTTTYIALDSAALSDRKGSGGIRAQNVLSGAPLFFVGQLISLGAKCFISGPNVLVWAPNVVFWAPKDLWDPRST